MDAEAARAGTDRHTQTDTRDNYSYPRACAPRVIGERERANLVVQLAQFFYIYIYIFAVRRVVAPPYIYPIFTNVSHFLLHERRIYILFLRMYLIFFFTSATWQFRDNCSLSICHEFRHYFTNFYKRQSKANRERAASRRRSETAEARERRLAPETAEERETRLSRER